MNGKFSWTLSLPRARTARATLLQSRWPPLTACICRVHGLSLETQLEADTGKRVNFPLPLLSENPHSQFTECVEVWRMGEGGGEKFSPRNILDLVRLWDSYFSLQWSLTTGSECSSCLGPVQNTAVNFTGQGFLMYQSALISIQRKQPFHQEDVASLLGLFMEKGLGPIQCIRTSHGKDAAACHRNSINLIEVTCCCV